MHQPEHFHGRMSIVDSKSRGCIGLRSCKRGSAGTYPWCLQSLCELLVIAAIAYDPLTSVDFSGSVDGVVSVATKAHLVSREVLEKEAGDGDLRHGLRIVLWNHPLHQPCEEVGYLHTQDCRVAHRSKTGA